MDTFNHSQSAKANRRLPLLDLDAFDLDALPEPLMDEAVLRRGTALPLRQRGNRLFAAVADSGGLKALDDLKRSAGLVVEPVLVEADKLKAVIDKLRQSRRAEGRGAALGGSLENLSSGVLAVEPEADEADDTLEGSGADDAPIVRFVNQVLLDAAEGGVSDIHFEPFEASYRIRFRTDGLLAEVASPPRRLGRRLAARLKVMAALDIAERRVPQDGRIKIRLSKSRTLDLRVNTLPTLWGEKVVLRILDPASASLGLDALGFEADQKALFTEALERPEGMILVTGPTGSGKTVTLYTALNRLNTPERNIATAEDPVGDQPDRHQSGQRQSQGGPRLRRRPARLSAPGSRRADGGRNPRSHHRRNRCQGGADGALGAFHPAHQLGCGNPDPDAQHRHRGLQLG